MEQPRLGPVTSSVSVILHFLLFHCRANFYAFIAELLRNLRDKLYVTEQPNRLPATDSQTVG